MSHDPRFEEKVAPAFHEMQDNERQPRTGTGKHLPRRCHSTEGVSPGGRLALCLKT